MTSLVKGRGGTAAEVVPERCRSGTFLKRHSAADQGESRAAGEPPPRHSEGDTIINIDGIDRAGKYVYCSYRSAPKSLTVNMKSGYVYVLSSGGNAELADGIVMETPVVINMTGGSVSYLLGGAYQWVTMKGNATINVSDGVILNGILGCGWRRNDDAGYVQRIGDVTVNLAGGTINQFVTTGGYGNLDGNGEVFVSGDVLYKQKIYGGSLRGTVTGNTSVTVTSGRWEGANAWILGGGEQAVTEGKASVTITNAPTSTTSSAAASAGFKASMARRVSARRFRVAVGR